MKLKVKEYLYNLIATNDGFETFTNVTNYLRDLLDKKEISSYSISPVVKTRQQFNHRQYFSRILSITVNGEAESGVAVDFSLTGVIYTLGTLDEEGIQRSLDDFSNTIRSVADSEWLSSFNENLGIFYTFYKELVGD